jgi:hypothetical protein
MIETIEEGLAIWLKEHGVKQDATFSFDNKISAFTFDEILKKLPPAVFDKREAEMCGLFFDVDVEDGHCVYYGAPLLEIAASPFFKHKNPAQAAGWLLKWCIENGHVKP